MARSDGDENKASQDSPRHPWRQGCVPATTVQTARTERLAVMANKIGILGDGNVGSALARGLKRVGHDVRAVGNDKQGMRDTAEWADVVMLAVPFSGTQIGFALLHD